ncbi:MAG: LEM3/CDC50 family protein [Terriglobus roseus]|nr:LEM3/CDC50 family protein [Terriglobus roseus]
MQVEEISIDYSHCIEQAPTNGTFADIPSDKVHSYFKPSNYTSGQPARWRQHLAPTRFDNITRNLTVCEVQFDVTNDIGPPVLLYYRLTEFYQNHRRYVKSFDQDQLKGNFRSNGSVDDSDCDPLKLAPDGRAYYPCGLIANSLFNDSFTSPVQGNDQSPYNMTNRGIAWDSDRDLYGKSPYSNDQVVPPRNWHDRYPNGYTENAPQPDLKNWEEFQVWMRTAGLPNFSKLALRNDNEVMRAGRYAMNITSSMCSSFHHYFQSSDVEVQSLTQRVSVFPVLEYGGTKSILISTRTVMGGKNSFLGIAYVAVGGLCVLLGALFTALHLIKPR